MEMKRLVLYVDKSAFNLANKRHLRCAPIYSIPKHYRITENISVIWM